MCVLQSEPATEEQTYCSSTKKDININTTIFNININSKINNMIKISRNDININSNSNISDLVCIRPEKENGKRNRKQQSRITSCVVITAQALDIPFRRSFT